MKWSLSQWKRSRGAQWALGIGIALSVYALVGFVILPALIKWQLLKRLPGGTHRLVAVQRVGLNPFTLTLTIRGFALQEPNGKEFCSFDELRGRLRLVSILRRAWVFQDLRLKKPSGNIILQQDGTFNFANLMPESPSRSAAPIPGRPSRSRLVTARLCIEDGALSFHDVKRKSLLKLTRIGLALEGLSNQTNAPVSAVLSFLCNGTGTVAVQGTVLPAAQSGDLRVQMANLDLRAIQPYVQEIWKLEITGGALTATGRVRYAAAGRAAPRVQFVGNLGVAHFTSVDTARREEFLNLDSLTLSGLDLRYRPHGLDIAAIHVAGLRSGVSIHADKSSNWKGMLKNAEKLHDLIVALQLNKLFPFQIGTVSFTNGSFGFADRSIEPPVVAEIQEVGGTVTGLCSTRKAVADVDLHGKVDGQSTLRVSGTITPLVDDLKLDLALSLKNGEMPPGSPYAAKYAGYAIRQGQLSIDAHYVVDQRTLKAENKVTLQQLRLGAKSNSPDATQLPVKLAIALLQGRDGLLTFDVPVNGHLDDPQFQFGQVVTQVLLDLITKAVSNPFALLGSLFGGGEHLDFVTFEPGRSDLAAGQTQKLDTLAKALGAHPALELEITGSASTTNDRVALAAIKLHQLLKTRRIKELADAGTATAADDPPPVASPDPARLISPIAAEAVIPSAIVTTNLTDPAHAKQNFEARKPSGGSDSTAPALTDREAKLMETIEVTPAELRALMQARAETVRDYLVQTGQVTAARLFLLPPQPVDPDYQGQSRVDLSLQ